MATAAFRWAMRRGVPACYIERSNALTEFESRDGDVITRQATVDGRLADPFDPLDFLRCQLGEGEVAGEGERLTLSKTARAMDVRTRADYLRRYREQKWNRCFNIQGNAGSARPGDGLEYAAAFTLLTLGVPMVRRGVSLKTRIISETDDNASAEFDVIFTHGGKLWLVDCKDTRSDEQLLQRLAAAFTLSGPTTESQRSVWAQVKRKMEQSHKQVLKEDVMHIREIAGAMGQVICLRLNKPAPDVCQFARDHGLILEDTRDLLRTFQKHLGVKRLPTP